MVGSEFSIWCEKWVNVYIIYIKKSTINYNNGYNGYFECMPCEVITKNTFFIKNIGNTFYNRSWTSIFNIKELNNIALYMY